MLHELKSWPDIFSAIINGSKCHELRMNDRHFAVGDTVLLREYDPTTKQYTGRTATVLITYMTSTGQPCALSEQALHAEYCILSIRLIPSVETGLS